MEKFEPKNIKGAADSLPGVQIMRNKIVGILRRNFEGFGYLPLETAQLNYYDLLSYKYEDDAEILREIYKLTDQGGRDLGLRFDLTVPFCKVIAMNRNLRMPFKRYEIGKVFRNGPVKLGRTREFYQCDIDCVGVPGPHIEAEQISLAVRCFLEIGIEPQILFGSRKLLVALVDEIGIEREKTETVIGILDKLSKVRSDELFKELGKHMPKDKVERFVSATCMKFDVLEKQFAGSAAVKEALSEIRGLEAILREMGIAKYCSFAPFLARGLNIYTGTVWEVFDKKGRIPSSLGGGGRYDNIITNFIGNGQQYPAVGMSFGLEPICAVLNQNNEQAVRTIDLMVVPMQTEVQAQLFADTLRAEGVRVLVNLTGKNVGKAFEYANAENIPYVMVLGGNEVAKQEITVKKMSDGEQKTFRINEIKKITEYLK